MTNLSAPVPLGGNDDGIENDLKLIFAPIQKPLFSAESSLTKSRFSEAFDFIPTRSFIICQYINSYKAKNFPIFHPILLANYNFFLNLS